jgi:hypothetical protein
MRKGTIASSSSSGGMKVVVTGVLIMSSKSSKQLWKILDFRRLLLIIQGLIIIFMNCMGPLVFFLLPWLRLINTSTKGEMKKREDTYFFFFPFKSSPVPPFLKVFTVRISFKN